MGEGMVPDDTFRRKPKFTVRDEGETLNVLGDRQSVLLTGDDTEGRFTLVENENPPGVGPPPHVHANEDEVFYVLAGRVEFRVDGERRVGEAGTTVLLPRGSTHTWRVVGDDDARMLIMLMPAGLEDYFRELSGLEGDGQPDMEAVLEVSARHGIEFPGI
jgi:quercetin dioxygenase-like cupin family protein